MTLERASRVNKIPKFQKRISNKLHSSCIDEHYVSGDVKQNKNIGLKVVRHTRWTFPDTGWLVSPQIHMVRH